jgi:hypothetical protein
MSLPDSNPRKRRNTGTRPFPYEHEGRGPRCLACNEPRWMHPDGLTDQNPSKRPDDDLTIVVGVLFAIALAISVIFMFALEVWSVL